MQNVIAVVQRKGGVGKTTLSRYIAEYMARFKGHKTLAIDLDSQGNLSSLFLPMESHAEGVYPPLHPDYNPEEHTDWSGRGSSADLYLGDFIAYDVQTPTRIDNLEICPADSDALFRIERLQRDRDKKQVVELLRENLHELANEYDTIVIDTGPTTSHLMLSAVRAATHVLIPFLPEPQCGRGLGQMLGIVRRENEWRRDIMPELKLLGIVPNNVRPNVAVHRGHIQSMRDSAIYGPHVLDVEIPQRAFISELDSSQPTPQSVFDATRSDHVQLRDIFIKFCESIDSKITNDATVAVGPRPAKAEEAHG